VTLFRRWDVRDDTSERHSDRVQQALAYVVGRLAEPDDGPSLEELSQQARTAPFYFHRIFREATGEPVQAYIRRLRLEYAAYRLLLTEQPVLDIALTAGYDSNAAFTRAFKRWFGTPPAAFRAEPGTATAPAQPADGVRTERAPRRTVAFTRYFGSYAGTGEAWRTLAGELAGRGIDPATVAAVGIVYDGPEYCLGGSVRYDACAVLDGIAPGGRLGVRLLSEMSTAAASHDGPAQLQVCTYIRLVLRLAIRYGEPPAASLPFYETYRRLPVAGPVRDAAAEVQVAVG
jgi:AraC family transcriptional regulator